MVSLRARKSYSASDENVRAYSAAGGVLNGVTVGSLTGLGINHLARTVVFDSDAYSNAKQMQRAMDGLSYGFESKELLTVSPSTVLERLENSENVLEANRNLLIENSAYDRFGSQMRDIKQEVSQFQDGWPLNSYQWYPYLYGGTIGENIAGQLMTTTERVYSGENIGNFRAETQNTKSPYYYHTQGVDSVSVASFLIGGMLVGTLIAAITSKQLRRMAKNFFEALTYL